MSQTVDTFGKATVRLSAQQAELILEVLRNASMEHLTIEQVYAMNGLHYELQMLKDRIQAETNFNNYLQEQADTH